MQERALRNYMVIKIKFNRESRRYSRKLPTKQNQEAKPWKIGDGR